MAKKKKGRQSWTSKHTIVDGLDLNPTRLPKPDREQRQVPQTLRLLGRVLARFEYRGTWEVRFIEPTSKKGDLFRVGTRDGNNIYCFVKLGKFENMWKIVLVPSQGYVASEVFDNLLSVDPKRLFINERPQAASEAPQAPQSQPAAPAIPILMDRSEEASEPQPGTLLEVMEIPEETPKVIASSDPAPALVPMSHEFLRLDPKIARNFRDREETDVINRALIVAAILADGTYKAARRRDAIVAISRELALDDYVAEQGGYQDGEKAARTIVMTLCNESLMARKPVNGSSDTTSHYMLGPFAENRLNRIDMPDDLRSRLFTAEKVDTVESEAPEPEQPEEPSFNIAALSKEYEELLHQEKISEEMLHEAESKLSTVPSVVDLDKRSLDLDREIENLLKQIAELKTQLTDIEGEKKTSIVERKDAEHDVKYLKEEQKKIKSRLKELKKEITGALK